MLTIVTALPWEAAAFAARLRDRPGAAPLRVVVSGPGEARAQAAAATLATLDPPAGGILSAGVAGGLDPALAPDDLVLATRVHHTRARGGSRGAPIPASAGLGDWLSSALATAGIDAVRAEILSHDAILRSAAAKATAREESGAVAVQMEDYVWAQHARRAGIPFGSLRAILGPRLGDPAARDPRLGRGRAGGADGRAGHRPAAGAGRRAGAPGPAAPRRDARPGPGARRRARGRAGGGATAGGTAAMTVALVTGGTGFIGAHVVRALLAESDVEVRALVRPASDTRNLDGLPVERIVGDLTDSSLPAGPPSPGPASSSTSPRATSWAGATTP